MRPNPLWDVATFLSTPSVVTLVFWLLLLGSCVAAAVAWRDDPGQRTARNPARGRWQTSRPPLPAPPRPGTFIWYYRYTCDSDGYGFTLDASSVVGGIRLITVTDKGVTAISPDGNSVRVAVSWKDLPAYREDLLNTLVSP